MRHVAVIFLVLAISPALRADEASEETSAEPAFDAAAFAADFGRARTYAEVKRDVLGWHETTRNACVAFASSALRRHGVPIPVDGKRDGWGISRITFAFSDHLTETLGWRRIEDPGALRPGDLVFTSGAPDHVFVFHSYRSKRRLIARAIDNQGRKKSRPLSPPASSSVAGFAYALRAP